MATKKPTGKPKISKTELRFENVEVVRTFGQRMKEARELNKLNQVEAARLLGYANSSKLAKVELASDTNSVPFWLIPKAAKLYDVSIDFLFGISDDWEHDPEVSQQRQIGQWLFERAERSRAAELNAMRVLFNKLVVVQKAVSLHLKRSKELKQLVDRIAEINQPTEESAGWDDIKLGSKLLRFAIETVEEANGISAELKRYHAYVDVADKSANIGIRNVDIFEMGGE